MSNLQLFTSHHDRCRRCFATYLARVYLGESTEAGDVQ